MPALRLALKIDVDTDRGTRVGVPHLLADLKKAGVPATFLFSLGPDQTGRAITRILRPGFLKKIGRTSILELYGLRTLLNGTLLPAPLIGQRNANIMREVRDAGFEVGIHCYNHYRWQDYVHTMTTAEVQAEFMSARHEFQRIFGTAAVTAGAAGWQANVLSRKVYDQAELLYSSDTRGVSPFLPEIGGSSFTTLEIPTTLPTLDELMGRPEYPTPSLIPHLLSLLRPDTLNVYTLHAEIEGMGRQAIFQEFLQACRASQITIVSLEQSARELLAQREKIPRGTIKQGAIDGRSGLLAVQGSAVGS